MTKTLDVLDGFGLSAGMITDRVLKWADSEFDRFFEDYIKAARDRKLVEVADRGSTDVFPDSVSGRLPTAVIRQLCIYANRIYIHDPVIDLAEQFGLLDTHFERIMRTPNREDRLAEFRIEFAATIERLLELRPLIDTGVVHVAATQLVRPKREPGALYASDLYGPSGQFGDVENSTPVLELPSGLADYVNANIRISPAELKDGKVLIHKDKELAPTRMIAVRFTDGVSPMVFCLSSLAMKDKQDREGQIGFTMEYAIDGEPGNLDESTFRNWVIGESHKYIRLRLNELNTNLYLAAMARATFLTNIPSSGALVGLDLNSDNASETAIRTLLEVDLPYLSNVEISELAKARKDEASFQEFRVAFDKAFSELESVEERTSQDTHDFWQRWSWRWGRGVESGRSRGSRGEDRAVWRARGGRRAERERRAGRNSLK